MTTQFKRVIPRYYQDSRVNKLINFGERLFLSCVNDFNIYMDYERLIHQIMPTEIYREYIEIMSTKLEVYQSKFEDYAAFILENIEGDYGTT